MLTIERKAKEEEQKRQDEKRLADLRARFEPEYYSKVITGLRNEQEAAVWLKTLDFSDKLDEYPFYMDIPIKGEFVFPCDRRIWQSKLFETYVYTRFGHQLFRFNTKNIIDHIEQGKTGLIIDRSIEHYRVVLEEVIKKYFFYLQLLGFVTHNGITFFSNDTWYSESPVFLFPRDRVMADKLKNILATVDPCAPNINEVIFAKLFP